MSGGPYKKPVPPNVERVLELFEKGMTRKEVMLALGKWDYGPLYQMWLSERGCPTPRMMLTAELEKWGAA